MNLVLSWLVSKIVNKTEVFCDVVDKPWNSDLILPHFWLGSKIRESDSFSKTATNFFVNFFSQGQDNF